MSTIPRAHRLRLLSPRRTAAAAAPGGAGVAMVIGATSKWQSGGANTLLVHGRALPDDELPPSAKWGVGGAVALKFASQGFRTVVTTRTAANAKGLQRAIEAAGGEGMVVELDLASEVSISRAFAAVRARWGDPDGVVLNAGWVPVRRSVGRSIRFLSV